MFVWPDDIHFTFITKICNFTTEFNFSIRKKSFPLIS